VGYITTARAAIEGRGEEEEYDGEEGGRGEYSIPSYNSAT